MLIRFRWHLPIGAEDGLQGVIDLVEMKAYVWENGAMERHRSKKFPENMMAEAQEWREKLVEAAAVQDEALMERFFEDPDSITVEDLKAVIRKAVIAMDFCPVMCGSSFKNKGVQNLLDAVIAYLPTPVGYSEQLKVLIPRTGEDCDISLIDPEAPLSALAFKIATDPFVGRLCYTRIYSGKIEVSVRMFTTRVPRKKNVFPVCSRCTQTSNSRRKYSRPEISALA